MIFYFVEMGKKIEQMKIIKEAEKKKEKNIGILLSYFYVRNTKNNNGNKRFQDFRKLKMKKEDIDEN